MKRLFLAIPFGKNTKNFLCSIQDFFKRKFGPNPVKWVEKENLHLSLAFLGKISEKEVCVVENILRSFSNEKKLCFEFSKIGFFPNFRFPKVIWLGLAGDLEKLFSLRRRLKELLWKEDFLVDSEFIPHITIGRVRKTREKRSNLFTPKMVAEVNALIKKEKPQFWAEKIVLYESRLNKNGLVYRAFFKTKLL